ncbi:CidA/LrgA family protein [Ectobacillus ponti]|uniref:CidA/LrgA family protein n=1 Tax=Ectobacillus ponti TaxID=2961894 RepID=A0AA41X648_9BACI|nr:CidA/LrgA family protein [Ectobacillus ponti]MCP8969644.1 CidA/LrgA family protein [Ectobacillus ponti]
MWKDIVTVTVQIAVLYVLNELGYFLVDTTHVPVPGNVMGMLLLFILLATGAVKLKWIERGAALLVKHLAFFFIPIAVGLMKFGGLFLSNGLVLAVTLIVSISVGIYVTGSVSQVLAKRGERAQ